MRKAYETGDVENAIITAGQVVGLIHDIPSVKEIIDRIMLETENVITRLNHATIVTKER